MYRSEKDSQVQADKRTSGQTEAPRGDTYRTTDVSTTSVHAQEPQQKPRQ